MYQKEIIYMGLYKNGERLGNAGFLKVERRDGGGNLSLAVKNVPRSMEGKFPVRLYSGTDWKELDDITLREGGGQWERQERDSLEQVRLQVTLPGGYLVEGESRAAKQGKKEAQIQIPPEKPETGQALSEPVIGQAVRERLSAADREATQEPPKEPVPPQPKLVLSQPKLSKESGSVLPQPEPSGKSGPALPQSKPSVESAPVLLPKLQKQEYPEKERPQRPRSGKIEHICVQRREPPQRPLMADTFPMEGLKEDKWEQILDTYDVIHPYGDERVYVKLTPRDFIILPAKYQHLVNNSFLLHGFYNYRHVILGKEKDYYLGVPGVYYEREKMVALMFGFEAFECAGGKPEDGEFGYYLRKVEL